MKMDVQTDWIASIVMAGRNSNTMYRILKKSIVITTIARENKYVPSYIRNKNPRVNSFNMSISTLLNLTRRTSRIDRSVIFTLLRHECLEFPVFHPLVPFRLLRKADFWKSQEARSISVKWILTLRLINCLSEKQRFPKSYFFKANHFNRLFFNHSLIFSST